MSLISSVWSGIQGGFPRVSGDEPNVLESLDSLPRFSPRERG